MVKNKILHFSLQETRLLGEPTFLVLVAVCDVQPCVGANSLGGDILSDSLGVRENIHHCAISFTLPGHKQRNTIENKTLNKKYCYYTKDCFSFGAANYVICGFI